MPAYAAPALRSLSLPADASLPRARFQASRSRRRTSTLRPRGCVWAAEWPAGDAPAPLPPPFACHRRRDGQVQEPHVAQPVEQGAQERCAGRGLDTAMAGSRRPRSLHPAVCTLTLPRVACSTGIKKAKTYKYSSTKGVRLAAEWPACAAPARLPPRRPAARRSNKLHACLRIRLLRHRFQLAPARADPPCFMP